MCFLFSELCSWRADSRYCYPGRCPDVPGSCSCHPDFSGPSTNCMTSKALAMINNYLNICIKEIINSFFFTFNAVSCIHTCCRVPICSVCLHHSASGGSRGRGVGSGGMCPPPVCPGVKQIKKTHSHNGDGNATHINLTS